MHRRTIIGIPFKIHVHKVYDNWQRFQIALSVYVPAGVPKAHRGDMIVTNDFVLGTA